jgi:hypothetical protein
MLKKIQKLLSFAKMGKTRQDSKNDNEVQDIGTEALIYFFGGKASGKLPKN